MLRSTDRFLPDFRFVFDLSFGSDARFGADSSFGSDFRSLITFRVETNYCFGLNLGLSVILIKAQFYFWM